MVVNEEKYKFEEKSMKKRCLEVVLFFFSCVSSVEYR